jgi:hypothetical protein
VETFRHTLDLVRGEPALGAKGRKQNLLDRARRAAGGGKPNRGNTASTVPILVLSLAVKRWRTPASRSIKTSGVTV